MPLGTFGKHLQLQQLTEGKTHLPAHSAPVLWILKHTLASNAAIDVLTEPLHRLYRGLLNLQPGLDPLLAPVFDEVGLSYAGLDTSWYVAVGTTTRLL